VLRSAENFYRLEDYRSAYLLLDRLTQQEPGNFSARRLLARVLDVMAPEQAIVEWTALSEAEPDNPANHVGRATIALRIGRLEQLDKALAALKKLQPTGTDYNRLAAAAALAQGDAPGLRQALEGMVRADPGNAIARLGLASLQLKQGDLREAAAARSTLEEFARGDTMRIRATMVLLNDAPRRWPGKSAAWTQRQLALQLALGLDRRAGEKQYLWAGLKDQHEPDMEDLIRHMQAQPVLLPEDVAMLTGWMIEKQRAREALVWIESLDGSLQSAPAVLNAEAGCFVATKQWDRLKNVLLAGAWGPVPAGSVEYAFAAFRLRSDGNESKAENVWNAALVAAEPSQPGLRMLAQLAGHWQWPAKLEQTLWVMAQRFPGNQDAWQKLAAAALSAQDTAKIWRIYSSWARANPANHQVQVNRVVLGIFVRPNEPGLRASIEEIYRLDSDNPGSQLAQAMAYWRTKRWAEARALLDRIPTPSSLEPRLALARGLVLFALGQGAAAEQEFAVIPPGVLLPEEAALLAAARQPH
jgi:tetratricopeptide (TPR) repeat protein